MAKTITKKSQVQAFCERHEITEDQFYGRQEISGYLYLGSVTSLPDGFNPTVGGDLYLGSVTSLPDGFNPTVGGSLDLGSVTQIPDGFNPTVGGSLYLGSVTQIPDGFNPTVGGSLYLGSVTSNSRWFQSHCWRFSRPRKRDIKFQMVSIPLLAVLSTSEA
jgi:hypothetical protein